MIQCGKIRARQNTDENILWRMRRFVCCIAKTTDTLKIYDIIAFPLQQWVQERASMLRYMCSACLVYVRIYLLQPELYSAPHNVLSSFLASLNIRQILNHRK